MRTPLSYTPPDLQDGRAGAVRRRQVFFVPGYDPEARTRYRLLFVRELTRRAKRFGEARPAVSTATLSPDGLVQSWSVAAGAETGGTATAYDVLLWDDLVARDFRRPRILSVALLVAGTLHALMRGLIWRFYRLNPLYGNVVVYPFAMVVLLTALSAAIGTLVHAHLGDWFGHSLGWPTWVTLPLALAAGIAWIAAIEAMLNRVFFWQLLNDWVFNWQHGNGWRPDYAARLTTFTDRILARVAEAQARGEGPDEVMIVGHSTGGLSAAELAARLLVRAPELGTGGTALALVTLGSGLPLVAAQPGAHRTRDEVAALVVDRRIVWLDVQAPQDWMNFPGFNPALDLPLALEGRPIANPIVRSAQVREILTPETYARVRKRPFRMHFQFLLANERPGAYDFFQMMLGPQFLRDRALDPIVGAVAAPLAPRDPAPEGVPDDRACPHGAPVVRT